MQTLKFIKDLNCLLSSNMSIVRVVRFIVHHKFVVHKVEAVRASLEGVPHHLIDRVLSQLGKLVNMFAAVQTVRNAETKVKVECFEMLIPKKVTLNHPKLGHWLPSNSELHSGADCSKFQKLKIIVEVILMETFQSLMISMKNKRRENPILPLKE